MGHNKPIDKRVVQKVFEMSAAGESRSTVGAFFHHSRRSAQHFLRNYSSESFPVKNRVSAPVRESQQHSFGGRMHLTKAEAGWLKCKQT